MGKQFEITDLDGFPGLYVKHGGWRSEYSDLIRKNNLLALSVAVVESDLGFLEDHRDLRLLTLNAAAVADLRPLEGLRRLQMLTLNLPGRPRGELDFTAMPELRELGLYWNSGFDSLFDASGLEKLWLFNPPDPDLHRLRRLKRLTRLELSQGRKLMSIEGIESLSSLAFLGLYGQQGLESLAGIERAKTLRELNIESCKRLRAIHALAGLEGLEVLGLKNCGEIESLHPLTALQDLGALYAWESTNVLDGDLSPLLALPRLRILAMQSRRSYRPSVAEVETVLESRASALDEKR